MKGLRQRAVQQEGRASTRVQVFCFSAVVARLFAGPAGPGEGPHAILKLR